MGHSQHGVLLSLATVSVLWRVSLAASSGSTALFLQNSQLDTDAYRSANNIAYYGVYYVGTPARQFLACFDTGSGDTWLPSQACTRPACTDHDQYNPGLSSTETNTTSTLYDIQYGTGEAEVVLVYDDMSIAGVNITNQGFGTATYLTSDFTQTSCDGLVGLGFQDLSSTGALPPFLNAIQEGQLSQPLFSLWLNPTPGAEPAGELTFGEIDGTKYTGQLAYLSVIQESYWQVGLTGVTLGGQDVGVQAVSVIIDSGTTAIVMTNPDAQAINSVLPGAVYWAEQLAWNVTCQVSQLPNVTFVMSGQGFSVPPALYVQELTDLSGNSLGVCSSAIIGGGSTDENGNPVAVLGTNFLRAFYSVFEVNSAAGTAQVGLAPAVGTAATSVGGRRLMNNGQAPLFTRTANSLRQHKWGHGAPQRQQQKADVEHR